MIRGIMTLPVFEGDSEKCDKSVRRAMLDGDIQKAIRLCDEDTVHHAMWQCFGGGGRVLPAGVQLHNFRRFIPGWRSAAFRTAPGVRRRIVRRTPVVHRDPVADPARARLASD